MLVEEFHQLGKVGKRPGEPVDLIDDDDVDLPGSHIVKQYLKGRALQGCSGQAPIIIPAADEPPAFVGLTLYVGFAGLALGVERVELEVEIMFGGFAGIDCAPGALPGSSLDHRSAP